MWLDDDGEEPEGSSFPDPSTRQWRHPSEIAAENARAAAAAANSSGAGPTAVLATAPSSTSILWPITVVGGCIAVAALGVFGLYLTGASTNRDLIASAATSVGPTDRSTIGQGAAAQETDPRRADTLGSESDTVTGDTSRGRAAEEPAPTTTTSVATTTSTAPTTLPTPPLREQSDLIVGPALYASSDLERGRIAGVVVIDRFLITSASAVSGYDTVSLRINGTWITADIAYTDPFSDVAIVVPAVPVESLNIPQVRVGGSVNPGSPVYLGYCKTDADPSATAADVEPGCSPSPLAAEDDEAGSAASEPPVQEDPATPETTPPPDPPPWVPNPTPPETPRYSVPEEYGEDEVTADSEHPGTGSKPGKDPRAGTVYSLSQTLRTLDDHLIYEPIRTEIPREDGVAGSPLRDADGRIVGLVVGSPSPNISALPVDRALAVAISFQEIGIANPTWLGIEGQSTGDGVSVSTVDELGPAFGILQPGDLLDTVAGQRLTQFDHLIHVTRQVGVDGPIELWVNRKGDRFRVEIVVAPVVN